MNQGPMLHVRSIFPEEGRVETQSFDLTPTNPQGEAVCSLIERFLVNRPTAFRDRLSFLKKGDFELDWSAVTGGVALASLFQGETPASMCVLLAGVSPDTDTMMLEVFRENVLEPLFGDEFDHVCTVDFRPLLVQVVFPGSPEWLPAVQLLSVSVASVYFRTVLAGGDSGGCCGGG
ncbi:MAG: hypothetical protein SGI92_28310 [Bryobacteraceae bacterium]|nr:hypothetical protein [Bryobacteraceae bacterium]